MNMIAIREQEGRCEYKQNWCPCTVNLVGDCQSQTKSFVFALDGIHTINMFVSQFYCI